MTTFELSNLLNRYFDLVRTAKREEQERYESADQAQGGHPPDVPDQRKSGDDRKERSDESDRAVLRSFDWLIFPGLSRRMGAFLPAPIRVSVGDIGRDCKVPGRGRRCCGPFQRAAVPWIAGHVAVLLPLTN